MKKLSNATNRQLKKGNGKNHSIRKILIAIYFWSLFVHLLCLVFFINQPIALDDMYQYDMLGRSLKNGNGYRWYAKADVEILKPYYSQFLDLDNLDFPENGILTTFRAPGYPFFLAFIYSLVPNSLRFVFVRIVQAFLVALLAPISAYITYKLNCKTKTIVTTGILSSLYPVLLFYPIGLASENLYIVLGVSSLIATILSMENNKKEWILFAALLCGFAMLSRSIYAIYVFLVGIWIAKRRQNMRQLSLLFILVAFGICMPWAIRNSIIMKKPAFVENSLGYNLFIGYHPEGDGGFVSQIAIQPLSILDDGERNTYCLEKTIEFIHQNPTEVVRRFFVRLGMFIGPEIKEFTFFYTNNFFGSIPVFWLILIYLLLTIPWMFLVILGPVGMWHAREKNFVVLIIIFVFGYSFPHFLILAEPRFHYSVVPVLVPFVSYIFENRNKIEWGSIRYRRNWIFILIYLTILICFGVTLFNSFSNIVDVFGANGNTLRYSY